MFAKPAFFRGIWSELMKDCRGSKSESRQKENLPNLKNERGQRNDKKSEVFFGGICFEFFFSGRDKHFPKKFGKIFLLSNFSVFSNGEFELGPAETPKGAFEA